MMNEVDYIIDLVEKNKEKLIAINKEFYQALVDELSIFIHGGYYDYTDEALALIGGIIVGAFQNSGYFKNAKNFQKELSKIVDRTKLFYKDDKGMTFKKLNENNVRIQRAIDDVMFDLTGKGFEVNVMRKIENKVFSDIVLKREVKESFKELKQITIGEESLINNQNGLILQENLLRLNGTANDIIKKENKLDTLKWIGSLVEESRPMCTHIRETYPNGMTIAEVNKVLNEFIPNGEPSDSQVKVINAKGKEVYRAKGSGLIEGTDITNITENRGGYNCRHNVKWVRFVRP